MLTLNTLRTRFGIVLSVVIVLALLAFILSLGPEMGLFGNDQNPDVAEIDGDDISLAEFSQEYNEVKGAYYFTQGQDASDENSVAQMSQEAWSNLLFDMYIAPEMEDLGIVVTDEEAKAMLAGEVNSAVYAQLFGANYTPAINAFLTSLNTPGADQEQVALATNAWNYIKGQAAQYRHMQKYAGLLKAGSYVNSLEVEHGVATANNVVDGRYVPVRLNTIPDDQVAVKESEVQAYYDNHKENYRKQPTRELAYVLFEVLPTEADEAAIAAKAQEVAEALKGAADEITLQSAIISNSGVVASSYVPASRLTDAEAVLFDGEVYGPELQDKHWVVSKAVKTIDAPEKLGISFYILGGEAEAMAEKIVADAEAGEDFATLAEKYQLAPEMHNYLTFDDVNFSELSSYGVDAAFAEKLASAKEGDVLTNKTFQYTQVLKIGKIDGTLVKHILPGTVRLEVAPSTETMATISAEARAFAQKAKGGVEAFQKAAKDAGEAPRTYTLSESDYIMPVLSNSRELVRWAQGAEKATTSEVLQAGEHYVVGIVTAIDEELYQPLKGNLQTIIAKDLMDQKRIDILKKEYAGLTIEQAAEKAGAEIEEFAGVKYGDYAVGQLYGDMAVVGAVVSAEAGNTANVVLAKNNGQAVVFVVDAVNQPEEAQTAEAEKLRRQTTLDEDVVRRGVGLAIESSVATIETSNKTSIHF